MNERKNDLLKARKLCNTSRFIDGFNFINDGGEFESSYCNIYPEELELEKKMLTNIRPVFGFRYQN